ncbi:MAG: type II toxin-antitoxin system VapC family toxin [Alphaproteobacteria bacterium]
MILLDTHAAIWLITEDKSLGAKSRLIIQSALAERTLFVSAITFWEIALLVSKGRLQALRDPADQRTRILESGIQELPLTGNIAILAVELRDLHGDPADRFIAATAIIHGATLMTADADLLRWQHRIQRQDASK